MGDAVTSMFRRAANARAKIQRTLLSRVSVRLVIVLLAVLMMIPLSFRLERGITTFDSSVWKNAQSISDSKSNPRYRMTKDLITQLEERRPTKAEVSQILGPSQDVEHPYSLQYWVGTAAFGFTPCQLRLYFDKDYRFEWARVVDDY